MEKSVQVASDEALLSLDAIYGLAVFLRMVGVPRRKVLDWLAEVIFGWIEDGGVILDPEGREIVIEADTIDDTHGEDGSAKWVSDARSRVENRPQRRSRKSMLQRMRLYETAARITTGRSLVEFGKDEAEAGDA